MRVSLGRARSLFISLRLLRRLRSLLNERQHLFLTISLSDSALKSLSLSLTFYQCHLIAQYTVDPSLVNLYFYVDILNSASKILQC